MPSFDIVSQINQHELQNAVDQANREINTRFDFKGSDATFELNENTITLRAKEAFQIKQMFNDILKNKITKRGIDVKCLSPGTLETSLSESRQPITVKEGIDKELAKKIVKMIKETKIKVQAAIQGEQIRVTGKKRDDLQQVIQALRDSNVEQPLQFINFRD